MFKSISLRTIISITVGILLTLMLVLGGLGLTMTRHAVSKIEGVSLRDTRQQAIIGEIMLRMETNRSQILQALQHNPATEYAKKHDHPLSVHFTAVTNNTGELKNDWEQFESSVQTAEARALVKSWYEKSSGLGIASVTAASQAIQAERWDEAEEILIGQINPGYKAAAPAYQALREFLIKRGRTNLVEAHDEINFMKMMIIAAALLSLAIGVAAGVLLLRSIIKPLDAAIIVAQRIQHGDLTVEVDTASRNEFGRLQQALHDMKTSLVSIVSEVRNGTDAIASASTQIATGNMDLSSRTEEQAGSLEETASSMEELTSTVKQNAENARQANTLALSASDVAQKGGTVVQEVVDTMGVINDSARKIVDIIGVIDGIAFQTNILALNAAVEAARAGEQGRGFAVVATEVRSLAQRSANAAKEIKHLISDSVEKVEAGTRLADQAGTTMSEVVASVKRVTGIIAEIAQASEEQRNGIEQVNQAIAQMDNVTQQNAALVEEAAAAAGAMQDQASSLSQMVSVFTLDTASRSEAAKHPPVRVPSAASRQRTASRPTLPATKTRAISVASRSSVRTRDTVSAEWEEF